MKKLVIVALIVVSLICLGTSVQLSDDNQMLLSNDVEVIELGFGNSGQPELGTYSQEPTEETGFTRLGFGNSGQPELGPTASENATVTVGFKNSGLPGHVEF